MRLAYMLMGIQRQRKIAATKSGAAAIPCVVSLHDSDTSLCLIVGVVPDYKSTMGAKFTHVVTKLKLEVTHDRFMSNIMIMPKDHLVEFIKEVGSIRD